MKRKTQSKRLTAKLKSLREQARIRMHAPVAEQHRWLCQVLRGHYAYYGLPSNFQALNVFYQQVRLLWFRSLRRRSQRRMTWDDYDVLFKRFSLPLPRITQPLREATSQLGVTFGKSRMRESRTYGSVRAKAEWLSYSTTLGLYVGEVYFVYSALYRPRCGNMKRVNLEYCYS